MSDMHSSIPDGLCTGTYQTVSNEQVGSYPVEMVAISDRLGLTPEEYWHSFQSEPFQLGAQQWVVALKVQDLGACSLETSSIEKIVDQVVLEAVFEGPTHRSPDMSKAVAICISRQGS